MNVLAKLGFLQTPLQSCIVTFLSLNFLGVAIAQEQGCFMLDTNGNPLDLGHLCGTTPNSAKTSKPANLATPDADFFVIPIKRRVGGTPVVDVKFNDQYVFEMLFDTGATMTVITESMANTLNAKSTGSLPFQTASNNFIFFETASVTAVSSGNLATNNFNVAIAPTLEMGLLGQDFYGMYDITIKYGTIELRKR